MLRSIIVVILIAVSSVLQAQVINTFPHYEDLETWTLCNDSCGALCPLSNGWTNQGNILFLTDNGGTPTGATGPSVDHNPGTATGKYVYIESSAPCNPDTALLETPLIDLHNVLNPGVSFWFHQLTATSYSSPYYVNLSLDSGTTWTAIDSGNTSSANTWIYDSVGLGGYVGNTIKLQFEMSTNNSFNDFALDDFTFHGLQEIDAGIDSVFSSTGFCQGDSSDICVNMVNEATLPIDSVSIFVTINGVPFANPFTFQGDTLDPGGDTTLCLGNALLSTGDTIIAYTSMPNGLNDTFNLNDTFMLIVTMNPLPDVNAGNDTTVCGLVAFTMGGNPTSTAATTFLWGGVNSYLNDSTIANPSASFSQPGTFGYAVTVTDTNQCSNADSVYVTVLNIPTIDAGADTTICSGDSVMIGGAPTAPASASVLWSNGVLLDNDTLQNPTASVVVSTDFVVTVTDTNNCSFVDTTFVFVFQTPLLDPGPDTGTCLGDSVQIGGSPTALNFASISWSPVTGLSNAAVANPNASPTSNAVYVITLVDTFGCTFIDSAAVEVYANPVADAGSDTTVCAFGAFQVGGAPTGPVTATYSWMPASLFNDSSLANPIATVASDTALVVQVTDTITGCTSLDTVDITILSIPAIDIGGDTFTLCEDDSIMIGGSPTAASGSTLEWSPGAYLNDSTAFNPQLYGVTTDFLFLAIADSASGCQNFDTALVIVNILPDAEAGPDETMCLNDSVEVGGSPTSTIGGVQYQWAPASIMSNDTIGNPYAAPAQDTMVYVTVTTFVGCSNTDSAFILVNPLPVPVVSPYNQVCLGDSAQLQVGGGVSYAWNFGQYLNDDSIANPLAAPPSNTQFTVSVTDANGCEDTAVLDVIFYPLPNVDAGPSDTICDGSSAILTASGAANYAWTPGGSLSSTNTAMTTASPSATTTYYVTGTDTNNCSVTDSATVFVNILPPASAGPDVEVCAEDSVQVGGSPTGPANATYAWQSAYINNTSVANPYFDASGVTPGVYTAEVQVTDVNGCSSTDQVSVTVNPKPNTAINAINTTICVGDTQTITATGGVSYVWSPSATLTNPGSASTGAYPDVTTDYTVTATNSFGCTQTATATVPVHPLTQANAGPDTTMCQQDTIELMASGGVSYQWNNSLSLQGKTTATPACFALTTQTFTVTVTDANGCSESDQVTVTVYPLPTVSAGPNQRICLGKSVQIGGTPTGPGAAQFQWKPNSGLSDSSVTNPTATPMATTDYTVVVTSFYGCQDSASVRVTVDSLPVVETLLEPAPVCLGDTSFIEVTPGFSQYQWAPTDSITRTDSADVGVYPIKDRTYALTVTNGRGCQTMMDFPITIWPLPTPEASNDREMCELDTIELSAKGGLLYQWSNGEYVEDSMSSITRVYPEVTTRFVVTVTDTNGCMDTTDVEIIVYPLPEANAGVDIENCEINSVYLGGEPTGPEDAVYFWTPQDGLSDPYDPNPRLLDVERTVYTVEVQDQNGCIKRDSLLVNADCYALIYAPSAFTPGSNDLNDEFKLVHYRVIEPELRIYDRNGQLLFETNDLDVGWDGTFPSGNAGVVPTGVYYWTLAYKSEELEKLSKQGTVTLLR